MDKITEDLALRFEDWHRGAHPWQHQYSDCAESFMSGAHEALLYAAQARETERLDAQP